ncbi:MAG: tetratricopeptide repeat protein [Pyrinomonadaceae bacterium]|nr:tetratricopeptide repeat protein [Pyrinomonadaceae bacterium]
MSFDKTKAMRNAEKYLSQGKIRAAISEYKLIVENDPKDFSTLNMLGDLHVKNSEKKEAVMCFTRVAEHYAKQGFAQKAIAIYNKIAKLQPDSLEVSARLAELYQSKGSIAEARSHYVALADQFQRVGKKMEALSIWKQIANLDPNNSEVCLKIAEAYWQENQKDEAAEAFTEAGMRLTLQGKHEAALTSFSRALEIRQNDFKALNGFVKSQINLGYSDEAAATLEKILEKQPYNRDILYLLVDCHLDTNNPAEAEKAVIKLVEQEPANYPKFLELIAVYLKNHDLEAAARILSMSSEHLLVGGQSDDFLKWTNEILARNPEQVVALRLLVRYYSWQRDEKGLKDSLVRLAEGAHLANAVDDERYALTQLIMISPHEMEFARRLQELNLEHGFESENLAEVPQFEKYAVPEMEEAHALVNGFGEYQADFEVAGNGSADYIFPQETYEEAVVEQFSNGYGHEFEGSPVFEDASNGLQLSLAQEQRLEKEVESLDFYIEQGYLDLADKTLIELEVEFGRHPKLAAVRAKLNGGTMENGEMPDAETSFTVSESSFETNGFAFTPSDAQEIKVEEIQGEGIAEMPAPEEMSAVKEETPAQNYGFFDDFRNDLGLEETPAPKDDGDYDTHYQMAVAYQEMGLLEEAIREFQDAIDLVAPNDKTRRFFSCATLLGHCFMEKNMPNLALMWLNRALEVPDLNNDEKQGVWYEIGSAYQAAEESENALTYFEKIYAVNVDYRDVGDRIQNLHVNS